MQQKMNTVATTEIVNLVVRSKGNGDISSAGLRQCNVQLAKFLRSTLQRVGVKIQGDAARGVHKLCFQLSGDEALIDYRHHQIGSRSARRRRRQGPG